LPERKILHIRLFKPVNLKALFDTLAARITETEKKNAGDAGE